MIRILWSEAGLCARQLARTRAFTLPAIAGLALAIGATTAIFSVYHGLLLSSMGFQNVGQLVSLWQTDVRHGQEHVEVCYADLVEWRKRSSLLEDAALASSVNLDFALTGDGQPQQVESTIVTGNFFRLLGAAPAAGRLLRDEDDLPNAAKGLVISHRLWQTRFGGDAGVVGRVMRSGADSFMIVGVAAADFDFPRDVDVWIPLRVGWPSVEQQSSLRVFRSIGRLKPGVNVEQFRAQIATVSKQIAETSPAGGGSYDVLVTPMVDEIFGNARTAIRMIGGAVFLVLLIACANASNLLLARARLRTRELVIRAALGAGRGRLILLLLMDGLVLALAAGIAGMLLAKLGISAIVRLAPTDIPGMERIAMNSPIVIFGIALTFATVLVFALVPALMASKRDPQQALGQAGTRLSSGRSEGRMRGTLIVLEVALSLVLLVSAGLLIRTFNGLARLDPGFHPERILTFRVTLEKPDQESRRAFYSQLLGRLRALPEAEAAGAVLIRPLSGNVGWDTVYSMEGQPPEEQLRNPNANYEAISPDYFRTMGIRLVAGRDFTNADTHTSAGVVIINTSTAKRHWPDGTAVGRHLKLGRGSNQPWLTVVGVVNDVRYREWEAVRPDLYVPLLQRAQHRSDFVIRTHGDPAALVSAVRREVMELEKDQPVSNVTTMDTLVDRALARSRFNGVLLGMLAASALILAVIGLFGVLSYTVAQRRGEIGIRIAVGAGPWQVVRMVTLGGLRLTMYGMLIGAMAAWVLSRLYSSLLFGVSPLDPLTYFGTAAGLFTASVLACTVPAVQAASFDPIQALKSN